VIGVSRQAGLDVAVTEEATPGLLAALTEACPVRVPFISLVALVRRRRREIECSILTSAP
jgi:hypothetical protein